jgi:hypothetical protein
MTDWQPIETAPKDGTLIDILGKRWIPETDSFIFQRFAEFQWNGTRGFGRTRPDGSREVMEGLPRNPLDAASGAA